MRTFHFTLLSLASLSFWPIVILGGRLQRTPGASVVSRELTLIISSRHWSELNPYSPEDNIVAYIFSRMLNELD